MGIFKRLFTWGKAEANAAIDQIEDPIKMTEQGIRDLREDLDKSIQSLAEVKAIAIRTKREADTQKQTAADYEAKARALLLKASGGGMDMEEAKRLAAEALSRKEQALTAYTASQANSDKYSQMAVNLEAKINELKSNIAKWENELRSLKARNEVSKATSKINKQLAGVDSSDTVSMLNKMKDKVEQQEALAEAYGDIASVEKNIDTEINKALEQGKKSADLDALMQEMGLLPKPSVVELNIEPPVAIEADKQNADKV